jgi:chromosome segregation ATPase
MLNPWLILGTIAFITSFGVSLLMTGDLGAALIASSLALGTALVTAAVVNLYHKRAADHRLATLKHQIRLLQRRRAEEEQAVIDISAEKERVVLALNSMQDSLRQRQLPSANPYATPALSWDLSTPAAEMPVAIADSREIQAEFHPASLTQFITEAAATKQKITATLNHLQSELSQVSAQVNQQRERRDQLTQDIQHLSQQKQQLTTATQKLTQDVQELERCRHELDQYVVYVEAKKQELEAGTNPLQSALKQLQEQVTALQAELRSLEAQISAKRQEKATLDQPQDRAKSAQAEKPLRAAVQQLERQKAQLEEELASLKQVQAEAIALQQTLPQLESQKASLEADLAQLKQQQAQSKTLQTDLNQLEQQKSQLKRELAQLKQHQGQVKSHQDTLQKLEKQIRDRRQEKEALERQITQLQAQKTALRHSPPPPDATPSERQLQLSAVNGQHPPKAAALERPTPRPQPQPQETELDAKSAEQELSDLWTEFMVQLPEYELQALKAIAHDHNPTPVLNRIADDNFTTSDELIDSINQLAEDTVGEEVIKTRGSAPPIIMRDHQRTIKKLIETYEYLTE